MCKLQRLLRLLQPSIRFFNDYLLWPTVWTILYDLLPNQSLNNGLFAKYIELIDHINSIYDNMALATTLEYRHNHANELVEVIAAFNETDHVIESIHTRLLMVLKRRLSINFWHVEMKKTQLTKSSRH